MRVSVEDEGLIQTGQECRVEKSSHIEKRKNLLSLLLFSLFLPSSLPFSIQYFCFRNFPFWGRCTAMRKTLHSREVWGFARTCCEASNLRPGTTNAGGIKELAEAARPGPGRGGKRSAGVPVSTWRVSVPVCGFVCGSGYDEVGVCM